MMISSFFLPFLGAISLFSAARPVSAASSAAEGRGGLRKALHQVAEPQQELMCQLGILHTSYMNDDNQITGEEETTCTLVEDGVPTPFVYPIVLPNEFIEQHETSIKQGHVLVSIRGASLIAGEYALDNSSEITVIDANFSPRTAAGRRLLETKDKRDATGNRHLIAFRINGFPGERTVVNTTTEINRALFDDGISVKTQYKQCSKDKLTWVPEGVYDVYLPRALDSYIGALDARTAAYQEIKNSPTYKQKYGTLDVREVAHNIIFCIPPSNYTGQRTALCNDAATKCQTYGSTSPTCITAQDKCTNWKPKQGFIGNAENPGTISSFSNKWCADLSTVMHETAHNFGRGHAGRNGNEYGDFSSNLSGGTNWASATAPQKCFNGAENGEFGWYKDNTLNYTTPVGKKMFKLVSLVDVRKAGAATVEPVIIKIGKYNIQYNQGKSYNTGAGSANRVMIVTDTDGTGISWVQAELNAATPQWTFTSGTNTVYVNFCQAVTGTTTKPDAVYVGVGVGGSGCTTIPP